MTSPLLESTKSFSFMLNKGEMILLQAKDDSLFPQFIQELTGLQENQTIRINGVEWSELSPYQQTSLRGQIRILHNTNAFINNLDLYENISLPLKHHLHLSDSEIMTLLDPYLSIFNAAPILKLRPYEATKTQLKTAQWLRLFIGSPILLILQNPALHTPSVLLPEIEKILGKHLDSGGGVLFLNTETSIVFESLITKRYIMN